MWAIINFRYYLTKFSYPHIHVLQYIEYGFPLGLWSDSFLSPCEKNHSSSYSFYTHIDEFVETELEKLGLTGPFENGPFENTMLSPLMTSSKNLPWVVRRQAGYNCLYHPTPPKKLTQTYPSLMSENNNSSHKGTEDAIEKELYKSLGPSSLQMIFCIIFQNVT